MGIGFRKALKLVRGLNVSIRHHQPTPTTSLADYSVRSISGLSPAEIFLVGVVACMEVSSVSSKIINTYT